MKRTLFYILLFSGLLIVADCCARPVVGFITNGEGCNVDWRKELPEYDVADAGEKNFLLSQQSWNLDERLLNRRPDCCMVYSGLPEILLGQPLPRTLEAYRTICERLDAAGTKPVILLTLPASGEHPGLNDRIARLNEALRAFAANRNYACSAPSAGLTEGTCLSAEYISDGLMLNEAGLARFAANIRQILGGMLPSGEPLPASVRANLASEVIRRILAESPAKVRIVLLGDSLTANGKDWNPRLGRNDVRNAGQGGYLTAAFRDARNALFIEHQAVDQTVVQSGGSAVFDVGGVCRDDFVCTRFERVRDGEERTVFIVRAELCDRVFRTSRVLGDFKKLSH